MTYKSTDMVSDKHGPILTPFNVLLGTISSHLTKQDVRHIKVQLQGHLNKECLESLQDGHDVTDVLCQRGIVTDKKLAFLRKLLVGCQKDGLVELVDEFRKSSSSEPDGQVKQERLRVQKRLNNLRVIMERQAAEIQNYKTAGNDLNETLDNKHALLNSHKEVCISQYEDVENLCEQLATETMDRDMLEERVTESDEVIKLQEDELKNLQEALKNSRLNIKRESREKRVSVFDKHSNDKSKKSLESLMKQKEDKEETLKKYKEGHEEIAKKLHAKRDIVRQINLQILEKTKDLAHVDQEILESFEEIRKLRQQIRQNEIHVWDIGRELEETQEEYEKTEKKPIFDKPISIRVWRLEEIGKPQKVLKYDDILEENSYSIGCYGNRIDPLQFDSPRAIAVTRKDMSYIADHGNCRLHVIDEMGIPVREAITMNSTYPSAMAVNRKGNIIISDSQIIKVFTSDGMLSHNFLPIYNNRDERPSISALAVDKEGCILAADFTNHRIQKFRIDGHFLGFIGGSAYLRTPSGLAVTKYGDVIVSEYKSHQLKVFYQHGKSYSTFGRPGIGKGHFMNPRGLAIDNKGNILVADSMNHRVQVINMDGQYVSSFGRLGSDRGCLDTPYAVAVNRKGHVFVVDSGNHRLTVFT